MTTRADGALEVSRKGAMATLTLQRPAARNALNLAILRDLPVLLAELAEDETVRVLVVQGAGGNFASGADISEFDQTFADHAAALAYGALLEQAIGGLAAWPKPVLAKIEGYCIGAGLALALACDLRLAGAGAKLGAPPAKLGLIYSLGDTRRLVNAVGPSAAKAMLFTARLRNAPEALRLGLVDEVYSDAELEGSVDDLAQTIASLSPRSIRTAKAMVGQIMKGVVEDTDETRAWFADAATGEDFAEGLAAFHAKRPPAFS
jgi:enoyl-CoA hydratase/carnithine racemase